jgi:hypothetical protein
LRAVGVGHPQCDNPQALSDVRRTDARSRGIDRPDGVTCIFQVSLYNVELSEAALSRHLLAKHDVRAALADETEPCRPEMSLIVEPLPLSN